MTEQRGPFYIERKGNCIVVRSKHIFNATLSMDMQAEQQAAMYALPPMALEQGMTLLLHVDGNEDIVVTNGE